MPLFQERREIFCFLFLFLDPQEQSVPLVILSSWHDELVVSTSFLSSCFYLFPLYLHPPFAICFPAPLPLSPSHMYLMCSKKYILSYVDVFSMVTDILFNTSFSFCFLVLFSPLFFTRHSSFLGFFFFFFLLRHVCGILVAN